MGNKGYPDLYSLPAWFRHYVDVIAVEKRVSQQAGVGLALPAARVRQILNEVKNEFSDN